jgi:hypothetical protein
MIVLIGFYPLLAMGADKQDSKSDEAEHCKDAASKRAAEAVILKEQADSFKLRAREYHLRAEQEAKRLKRLREQAFLLKGKSREEALPGKTEKSSYANRLSKYKSYADKYKSHLEAVNQQSRQMKASTDQFNKEMKVMDDHCQQYSAHASRFHHGLVYPHVCPPARAAHRGAMQSLRRYQRDMQQVRSEEARLMQAESQLKAAEDERFRLEQDLLRQKAHDVTQEELSRIRNEYSGLRKDLQNLR